MTANPLRKRTSGASNKTHSGISEKLLDHQPEPLCPDWKFHMIQKPRSLALCNFPGSIAFCNRNGSYQPLKRDKKMEEWNPSQRTVGTWDAEKPLSDRFGKFTTKVPTESRPLQGEVIRGLPFQFRDITCRLRTGVGGRDSRPTRRGRGPQATDSDNVATNKLGNPLVICDLARVCLPKVPESWASGLIGCSSSGIGAAAFPASSPGDQVRRYSHSFSGVQELSRWQFSQIQFQELSAASLAKGRSALSSGSLGPHHWHAYERLRWH